MACYYCGHSLYVHRAQAGAKQAASSPAAIKPKGDNCNTITLAWQTATPNKARRFLDGELNLDDVFMSRMPALLHRASLLDFTCSHELAWHRTCSWAKACFASSCGSGGTMALAACRLGAEH